MNAISWTCWEVNLDTVHVPTRSVIEWCQKHHHVDRFLFGLPFGKRGFYGRRRRPCLKQVENGFRYFGKWILGVYSVEGWPGTEWIGGRSAAIEIQLNSEVVDLVVKLGPKISDWQLGYTRN